MVGFRRTRGLVLRLAHARRAAAVIGVVLCGSWLCLAWFDFPWESWLTDGLGLVLGATGVAVLVTGLGGRRPDWIDE